MGTMMKRFVTILLLALMLNLAFGCAKKPSPEELANANYGPYPNNYQELIKERMAAVLYDPYSAMYEFPSPPIQGWGYENVFSPVQFGWRGIFFVNAKNRMGGYVGRHKFGYVINSGRVTALAEILE